MLRRCSNHTVQLWLAIVTICVAYADADISVFSTLAENEIVEEFRDVPARFGKPIPEEGITGIVVYADPPTACDPIAEPPRNTSYDGKWIAVIARWNCTFEKKVQMAQEAGYDAAIIHNVGSDDLESMSAKNAFGIIIPSVFVGSKTGHYLRSNYQWYDNYFILINVLL